MSKEFESDKFQCGDGSEKSIADFLNRAKSASDSGDDLLSMYLYLAAFEESSAQNPSPSEAAISGLKSAWVLACTNKERQLAEYIFDKLEPYLNANEIEICAETLHDLALDKLEEFGFSREDFKSPGQIAEKLIHPEELLHPEKLMHPEEVLTYKNLVGYDQAKAKMAELGVGTTGSEDFNDLVELLNRMHGLDNAPALDPILFRSLAREDANRFMMATLGEIGKPTLHMRMEDGLQGMPVLCVSTHGIDLSSLPSMRDVFQDGGVLVLEDLDMWLAPDMDMSEDGGFFMIQLTRGAREAVELIQSAVEHPDVCVFATASLNAEIDGFFLDLLGPMEEMVIDTPTPEERAEIWLQISKEHPSICGISRVDLVRLTANMPRFDIYMAVREAIESAYKEGLRQHKYMPVTRENLFDKLAAYQPLDSQEFDELQEGVVSDFKHDLEDIDDLLKGE